MRVAIIGSGFGGIGMAVRLRQAGIEDFAVFERAAEVGGTWRDNTYPGCACDVPSHLYSFSFAPNPRWSRAFSPQPEILAYLQGVAERFGVMPHVRLGREVTEARWDEDASCWELRVAGEPDTVRADVLVASTGPLSEPAIPHLPGLEDFGGTVFHSARWDHSHRLEGERVAVIGTGASAVQFVPRIQPRVRSLTVFQRSAPWVIPRPDRAITEAERRLFARAPAAQKLARALVFAGRESYVPGFMHPSLLAVARARAKLHLRRQVPDPALRAKLTPDYEIGCKRILVSSDFYPALAEPNVSLVTDRIVSVTDTAIVTADGTGHETDTIIMGTGFRTTEWPLASRLQGRDGVRLSEAWHEGASAYLGTTVSGFPNLFLLYGPNTNLGHSSIVFMLESQAAYVVDALRTMAAGDAASVEVRRSVQDAFNADLQARLAPTVWNSGGCQSWYLDARGHNTLMWPGSIVTFRRRTRRFDAGAYELRTRSRAPVAAAA